MPNPNYRVILTGELKPGFSREAALGALSQVFHAPVDSLRNLFEGGEHPVKQEMTADQALDLQSRLDAIGVASRIEKRAAQAVDLTLRPSAPAAHKVPPPEQGGALPGRNAAGRMHCPACGHEQLVSNRCTACGIVFADYNRSISGKTAPSPSPAPEARDAIAAPQAGQAGQGAQAPAQTAPPEEDWRDAWNDFDVDAPPDESAYLGMFFGDKAAEYLHTCERYVKGPRTRFALGWNWAAVPSPFVWALYRKMWGWGLLIFITEIFVPVLLITLGSYGMLDSSYVLIGYVLLLVNRLFWPAVANYLYCRHARSSVQQLHMMSPNYATEIDIATAGGVSKGSVVVGLVLAGVMTLFLWSLVDSIRENGRLVVQEQLAQGLERRDREESDGTRPADDVLGLTKPDGKPVQNKWVATKQRLRTFGGFVNRWLEQHGATQDPGQLNLFKLRQTLEVPPDAMLDAWGSEIQYIPDSEGYRLISAGPDKLFGTADDLQLQRAVE